MTDTISILKNILISITSLNQDGNLIFKINNLYTDYIIKILIILKQYFQDVYIIKPLISRITNKEKYIICKQYNNNKELNNFTIKLNDNINKITEKTIDIFLTYKIPTEYNIFIKNINIILDLKEYKQNEQYIKQYELKEPINIIQEQINASTFWISNFFLVNEKDLNEFQKNNKII